MSVPKLRFPGFAGEWENGALGNLLDCFSGYPVPGDEILEAPTHYPLLRGVNITEGKIRHSSEIDRYFGGSASGLEGYIVKRGDMVLGMDGSKVGKNVALVGAEDAGSFLIQRVACLRPKGPHSLDFVYQLVTSEKFHKYVERVNTSSGIPHISLNQIREFPFGKPIPAEQQKIAAFLGALDAKLAALAARQAALGRFKAGLMQKLFSQQLRFARDDGGAFPDWQEKRLGEVFTWVKTNSLSREFLTHDGGEVQNIHYGDIHTKFRPLFRQAAEKVPFVGTNSALKPFTDEEYCRVGDVVIADASEDYADIGKAIEIVEVRERSLVAGLHTYIARPKIGSLVVGFSGYLLRSAPMRRQIMRIAQGISVLGVSKGNLEQLTFWVPHPDEQQKIADALSAMDAKIQAVADQVTKLQTFKKGLLQQMFV